MQGRCTVGDEDQRVLKALNDAVYTVDAEDRIQFCNTALERLTGYAVSALQGRPSMDLYTPEDWPTILDRHGRAFRGDPVPPLLEATMVRHDGTHRPVELSSTSLTRGGQVVGRLAIARDISIVVQRGFEREFLEFFSGVHDHQAACGTAMAQQQRVIVEDVATDPIFANTPDREVVLAAGARAVQSTPLFSRSGTFLGMLSTHFRTPHRPSERELRLMDLWARQAADLLEHNWHEEARRASQAQLEASLQEKEMLLKELRHRVKNNLQVISSPLSLQSHTIDDPHVRVLFQESQRRIRAMGLLHEMLYHTGDLANVSLSQFIPTLSAQLMRAYGVDAGRITLHLDMGEVTLPLDMAIPCGLILNELLSNCLKHAFPGEQAGDVTVTLTHKADCVTLRVKDNGCGFPAHFDSRDSESLGLQLVRALAEQLEGTITLERHGGTTFTLTFPLANDRGA